MGTHPIFESDFDCLTERMSEEKRKRKKEYSSNDRCYRCGLKGHYGYDCDMIHGKSLQSEKSYRNKRPIHERNVFNNDDKCYECGESGHYGYDCQVRLKGIRSGQRVEQKGRASPTYDDYDPNMPERGFRRRSSSRSRSRSRSPIKKEEKVEKEEVKIKSKNVRNIQN